MYNTTHGIPQRSLSYVIVMVARERPCLVSCVEVLCRDQTSLRPADGQTVNQIFPKKTRRMTQVESFLRNSIGIAQMAAHSNLRLLKIGLESNKQHPHLVASLLAC